MNKHAEDDSIDPGTQPYGTSREVPGTTKSFGNTPVGKTGPLSQTPTGQMVAKGQKPSSMRGSDFGVRIAEDKGVAMKFDHLSITQLSYLEGMVSKCAEHDVDPRIMFKLAGDIAKGWEDITRGISETGLMKWLASGGKSDVGDQAQYATLDKHSPFSGTPEKDDWRALAHKSMQPDNKLAPQQAAEGEYYRKMMTHPEFQAAAASKTDYGPKGLAAIGRGIYDMIMPGADIRKTRYGMDEEMAARRAQDRLREKYMQGNPLPTAQRAPGGARTAPASMYNTYGGQPDARLQTAARPQNMEFYGK